MRLRSPLRQVSPKTAQWRTWRLRNYGLLAIRCRGICEGCGQPNNLDPHHVAGREEEPFSSLVQLLAGLCRDCHRSVTGELGRGINVGLRGRLASDALQRLNERFGLKAGSLNEALRQLKKSYEWDAARRDIARSG